MPTANECYCCQELEELNQKFDDSGLCSVLSCSKASTVIFIFYKLAIYTGPVHRPLFVIHTEVGLLQDQYYSYLIFN